jgi:hypothetical protein
MTDGSIFKGILEESAMADIRMFVDDDRHHDVLEVSR